MENWPPKNTNKRECQDILASQKAFHSKEKGTSLHTIVMDKARIKGTAKIGVLVEGEGIA